ncbi:MAG TPA: EAL domain-containing protein [Burkholderiales bacterium]|nr:EAL domain-containing protein [Burkholderiales bacterium]
MAERSTTALDGTPATAAAPTGFVRAEVLYAEQVRQLYRLSRSAYVAPLLAALVVVVALWAVVPLFHLGLWAIAVVGVTAARYVLYREYKRRSPPESDAREWSSYFICGAGAMGMLWGILGSALYPSGAMPQEFLVMFIIAGMVISAVLVLAPVQPAFLAFLLPAMLPVIPAVFLQGTTVHVYMGVLLLIFLVAMLTSGPLVSKVIREALAMKFQHSELLAQVSAMHAAQSEANVQLNEQIYTQRLTAEQLRQASQKLSALIEASPLAIIVGDIAGYVEGWNYAAERIFGWRQEEVRGQQVPFYPPGREADGELLRRKILNGQTLSDIEDVRQRKDGKLIDVSLSAALVRDTAGRPAGYLTMIADITERKRVEQQQKVITKITVLLAEAHSLEDAIPRVLQTIGETYGFVYGARWQLDKHNMLLRCVDTWVVPEPELVAFRDKCKARLERPGKTPGLNRRVWESGSAVWISEIENEESAERRAAATQAGLRCAFGFPITAGGELFGVMEFWARETRPPEEDVMQVAQTVSSHIGQFIARKQAERNLQFVASHDSLTGLFNRSMFSQRLQQALAQAHRHERRLAVLFIDLDGFKVINDTLGHDAGDMLLGELAERLRVCMREGDTLGRMGGDEFVVLIEEYEEDIQLLDVARKVLETASQPFLFGEDEHRVTASIGIAAYPQDGRDASDLLRNADIAMYRAKEHGKNNYQFYSPGMNTHLVERMSLEKALRRALERQELTLFYQPKIGTQENRVTGVEALVRWQHPTQGLIKPLEFVQLAEETGLYTALSEWVLHTACAQLRTWQQRGLNNLRIAINLSVRQFAQDNLLERLREAIYAAGIEPDFLEIEVTESMLMRHAERAAKLLGQVKELGAHVVIDDFGTGHSSLASLKRFPIDAVKIDRSLVGQLSTGGDAAELTAAVISMAHNLKLQVTAEGVETRAQWEFLSERGCDAMQGNYFSVPAPADAIEALLQYGGVRIANVQPLRPRVLRPGSDTSGES